MFDKNKIDFVGEEVVNGFFDESFIFNFGGNFFSLFFVESGDGSVLLSMFGKIFFVRFGCFFGFLFSFGFSGGSFGFSYDIFSWSLRSVFFNFCVFFIFNFV